jgi:hypothetical protein
MAKSKKPQSPSKKSTGLVIEPSIRNNEETHIFEDMAKDGELPEMKAIGFKKVGKGAAAWVSYTVHFKGSEVTKIECDEPDLKDIAESNAKVAFVTNFITDEVLDGGI